MQKEVYKVSILVPIYGVEKFIERCAISLFEQSYKNIEYIFVNDYTKDRSIEILKDVCSRYPEKTANVKLINHNKNSGIATARNTALENISGDFFVFVDSDDWVSHDFIESLVESQRKGDYDIVTCAYKEYSKYKECIYDKYPNVTTRELMELLLKGQTSGRIWGRLINTSIIKDNALRFIDGANFAEDDMMMTFILFFAKKHMFINKCAYHYERRNAKSYTATFNYKNSSESLMCLDNIRLFFETNAPQYLDLVNYQELEKVTGHMILCCRNRTNKEFYNTTLLVRLSGVNRKYYKFLTIKNLMAVYLRYFELVRIYVLIGTFMNNIYKRLKLTLC